ncbi:MAG TPA: COX15/CtaA family protein, partial [Solirubrobacteraceae bacterium]|nr:COX15/CtaA family protein [Solirubrobacteraceae bacterium]
MRRRLPTFTPRRVEQLTLFALAALGLIVLTGAAVRLSGSGLGCPNWPKCGDSVVAPLETHAWIEYGNRLASALVGLVSFVAGFAACRRR